MPELPTTLAGTQFSTWLTAFNISPTDDGASLRIYNEQHFHHKTDTPEGEEPHDITADQIQLRLRTGGFDLVRVITDEETKVSVVLKRRNNIVDGFGEEKYFTLEVEGEEPYLIHRFLIDNVPAGKEE